MFVHRFASGLAAAVIAMGFYGTAMGADTVQMNIKSLLNARPVTTFSNGKLYTWTKGIDGTNSNGYVTHSAAVFLKRTDVLTLPDSARFPANANHPTMILNYSNSDSSSFQTHYLGAASGTYSGIDSVTFSVPRGNYSKMYIALTSSEGQTSITVVSNYTDGPVAANFTCPDYAQALLPNFFFVDSNMAKWNNQNVPVETTGHNINGLNLTVNSAKILTSVKLIKKTAGSYLVFWGATGVGTISTAMKMPSVGVKASAASVRALSLPNGKIQFVNVVPYSDFTIYSLSGAKSVHFTSAKGGSLTWNTDRSAAPGICICRVRSGAGTQRVQVMVGR